MGVDCSYRLNVILHYDVQPNFGSIHFNGLKSSSAGKVKGDHVYSVYDLSDPACAPTNKIKYYNIIWF